MTRTLGYASSNISVILLNISLISVRYFSLQPAGAIAARRIFDGRNLERVVHHRNLAAAGSSQMVELRICVRMLW
jgi:hypothetical protein